jgi:hypothetical protein
MASVTQRIPNYLGGVSQQPDSMKFAGQLSECINAYPDPTFGLIKRPGGAFLSELKDSSGNVIAPGTYDNGKWFSIFRDNNEQYIGVIKGTAINIWSLIDGTPRTVTYGTGATSYLTGTKDDYDVLTINDYTFITNKTVTVTTQAASSYTYKRAATIRLFAVEYGAKYEVVINGNTISYTTFNAEATITSPSQTQTTVNADVILNSLTTSIDALANITATRIGSAIEITSTVNLDITVKGGQDGEAMAVFVDAVDNISRLPAKATHGRIVKVNNSTKVEDDYYVEFIADNGVSGAGYWQETRQPDISPGLTDATMPHQLIRNANGTFTFDRVSYEPRLVGDLLSNSDPSFVGNTIQQLFFYNNRLGVLTEENVSLSQAGDYFNFYHTSALTTVASDPVDISCSSIRPATLHGVVPVAQGLLLFSRSQQFLLQGDNGILTPGGTTIKTISNYEMDVLNDPVDLGTTVGFISKTPSYSRVFEMQTQGQDDSPIVIDISRIVPEWIPSNIDQVVGSPQNSLLSLGSTTSNDIYLFRFYNSGEKREIQSWFRWKISGNLMHHAVDRDVFWVLSKQQNSYAIQKISLVQSPTSSTFLTSDGSKIDPRLDMWKAPTSTVFVSTGGVEYTKVYLPFKHDSTRTICVVTANPNAVTPTYSNSGLVLFPTVLQDGGGYYAKVDNLDLTSESLIVGYTYDMDLELPRVYYRQGNSAEIADYTATLTLARMKFQLGLTGDVVFKLQASGRTQWDDIEGVRDADYYLANDIPFAKTTQFTIPIHQKSENIRLRVFSDSPFPVSLISMMWEGNYSPRFYRRA